MPVEITLNGQDFTDDGFQYGFYDPFVYNVNPKMISKKGNSYIRIIGHGFINTTGSYLKVKFGLKNKPLKCGKSDWIFPGKYIDKNTV